MNRHAVSDRELAEEFLKVYETNKEKLDGIGVTSLVLLMGLKERTKGTFGHHLLECDLALPVVSKLENLIAVVMPPESTTPDDSSLWRGIGAREEKNKKKSDNKRVLFGHDDDAASYIQSATSGAATTKMSASASASTKKKRTGVDNDDANENDDDNDDDNGDDDDNDETSTSKEKKNDKKKKKDKIVAEFTASDGVLLLTDNSRRQLRGVDMRTLARAISAGVRDYSHDVIRTETLLVRAVGVAPIMAVAKEMAMEKVKMYAQMTKCKFLIDVADGKRECDGVALATTPAVFARSLAGEMRKLSSTSISNNISRENGPLTAAYRSAPSWPAALDFVTKAIVKRDVECSAEGIWPKNQRAAAALRQIFCRLAEEAHEGLKDVAWSHTTFKDATGTGVVALGARSVESTGGPTLAPLIGTRERRDAIMSCALSSLVPKPMPADTPLPYNSGNQIVCNMDADCPIGDYVISLAQVCLACGIDAAATAAATLLRDWHTSYTASRPGTIAGKTPADEAIASKAAKRKTPADALAGRADAVAADASTASTSSAKRTRAVVGSVSAPAAAVAAQAKIAAAAKAKLAAAALAAAEAELAALESAEAEAELAAAEAVAAAPLNGAVGAPDGDDQDGQLAAAMSASANEAAPQNRVRADNVGAYLLSSACNRDSKLVSMVASRVI
jgi:hypothetical protein